MPYPQRSNSIGGRGDIENRDGVVTDSPYTTRMPLMKPGPRVPLTYMGPSTGGGAVGRSGDLMNTPELLKPSPGNPSRQSQPQTATFNLIASVVGGGVLSIPYAFSLSGILLGTVLLVVAAIAGDFSLYVLCACSRRTGKTSYVQVARVAFGTWGAGLTTFLLLILSVFVLIAYMVLVRDIWAGLVGYALDVELDGMESNQVLLFLLIICLPGCLATNLYALRHMCYIGFFSAVLLTAAIGYRSVEHNNKEPGARADLKLAADNWGDVMEAFPILSLAYLCHFNMLSVQSQLVNPTRERLKGLLHGTIGMATCMYIVLGMSGYMYAYSETKDDILLNFLPSDSVMLLGRLGMGITMLVAIIMITLPCRDVIYEVVGVLEQMVKGCCHPHDYAALGTPGTPGTPNNRVDSCLKLVRHVVTTLGLLAFCLFCATSVPGVGIVWSVCGSSVGFIICYLLPAVFYLKIRSHKEINARKIGAWVVILVAIVMTIICTKHAVAKAITVV